mmetsp:Transcript_1442/g.1941  ORF Transcript_1442/g.1941 Transcript_1442/m.1941 type:complete len:86 (-) Transcript_1442:939-1196(-)
MAACPPRELPPHLSSKDNTNDSKGSSTTVTNNKISSELHFSFLFLITVGNRQIILRLERGYIFSKETLENRMTKLHVSFCIFSFT